MWNITDVDTQRVIMSRCTRALAPTVATLVSRAATSSLPALQRSSNGRCTA
jgi:hypothetical protein